MKWIPLGVLVYVTFAILTYGGLNASDQWLCHHRWRSICNHHMVRDDQAHAVFFALVPPAWLSAMFVTAFYQDGFSFTATPEINYCDEPQVINRACETR